MARISIVYGTREGQTAKIADTLAETLKSRGFNVTVDNAKEIPSNFTLTGATGIIVGASLHFGSYEKEISQFITKYNADLKSLPSAFFSVSGADSDPVVEHRKRLDGQVKKYLDKVQWEPKMIGRFGGCVAYTKYGFFKRMMMVCISSCGGMPTDTSKDHEFTDWEQVKGFANKFVDSLEGRPE